MQLNDKVNFIGEFSIKTVHADGTFDEYVEKNLIMDTARSNMAQLLGGVTTGGVLGNPINKFVIGTEGHVGTDILAYKAVGTNGFDSTLTALFSETSLGLHYDITFDATGGSDVTVNGTGSLYDGGVLQITDAAANTVNRTVTDRTVTYTITIPTTNGNSVLAAPNDIIAYTEAALYAGTDIFSMKTYPARVKENTVELIITWSIIF